MPKSMCTGIETIVITQSHEQETDDKPCLSDAYMVSISDDENDEDLKARLVLFFVFCECA